MGTALTSIGIKVSYAPETTAGVRPTTGYTKLPDIKGLPDFNPAPEAIETTTFDNLVSKSYTKGLVDYGNDIAFPANLTPELKQAWNVDMFTIYSGLTDGKRMWFCIDIPGFEDSTFIPGEPTKIGLKETDTNALLETELHITPAGDIIEAPDPEYTTDNISGE